MEQLKILTPDRRSAPSAANNVFKKRIQLENDKLQNKITILLNFTVDLEQLNHQINKKRMKERICYLCYIMLNTAHIYGEFHKQCKYTIANFNSTSPQLTKFGEGVVQWKFRGKV